MLNFWSEIGIFGLLIFILLLAKYFFNYLKVTAVNRSFYQVLICVMIALLFHGLVDVQYFKNDLSVLFWFWLGLSWLMIKGEVEMK
jgi:O-antigen ligase